MQRKPHRIPDDYNWNSNLFLAKFASDAPDAWYKHVSQVQRCLNSTFNRSTKRTPFELMFGVTMKTPEDIRLNDVISEAYEDEFSEDQNLIRKEARRSILDIQRENTKTYNKKRKVAAVYKMGDVVAIKRTQFGTGMKLRAKFLGPYTVIKANPNERYDLEKIGGQEGPQKTTSSADQMKHWIDKDAEDSVTEEDEDDN